jgi:hypothetical protein
LGRDPTAVGKRVDPFAKGFPREIPAIPHPQLGGKGFVDPAAHFLFEVFDGFRGHQIFSFLPGFLPTFLPT